MSANRERPTIDVALVAGGWPFPWPSVTELAEALPAGTWTLVGGLMTQLHSIHHGLGIVRPTNDVDIVLHIETTRGVPGAVAAALKGLGYRFQPSIDIRNNTAHRFVRDRTTVDLVAGSAEDQVDVLIADHPAPRVIERLHGHEMVRIEGGTQALRRTINARVEVTSGRTATISVPRPFGGVVLKAAAYTTDSRDRDRHLFDAAALLACIDDPFVEREDFIGSDRRRVDTLATQLGTDHPAWRALPPGHRTQAQLTLEILAGKDAGMDVAQRAPADHPGHPAPAPPPSTTVSGPSPGVGGSKWS
ncbi:GSU2403 family nucleotidyltransferase fold protein [Myceligenerans xiligouense]|uniref:Nucleotidyltransferase-like protein n=1 Tax=Myceligenerans xiligouense TaxID=253184 RepID=A0A3N4YL18_9MICO|nr:GSU2403 family nucleotidyltransferase fold protein [Myceligenerans xiligouense]RPF20777.1 nucleotidyltransferase-like protein [Myceligenerans xiligouense]